MRLLFVTTGLSSGGAERQLVQLALRLQASGHLVSVASMLPPQALQDELAAAKIPLICLNMSRRLPNPMACFRLGKIVNGFQPDVVHAHMIHANLLARVTRLFCRMPVLICTAHNVYEISTREKVIKEYSLRDFLYRVTDPLADLTTQICRAGAERYLRVKAVSSKRMKVVYNGVDLSRFTPDAGVRSRKRQELGLNEEWAWFAAGRFEEAKDYPNLLNAFSIVRQNKVTDRLFIAGDGPFRALMEEKCQKLGLSAAVTFLGIRKDVAELMQAADAFVMSSMFEGLPLVLIEAHASGLPIVATNVGGNPEVVRDGLSGCLCEPRNPEALANVMLRLRSQPREAIAEMSARGREHASQSFDLEKIVIQWEELYRELSAVKVSER